MKFDAAVLLRALSPKLTTKALQTFDRATTIVVGACWGAALLMVVFALYTVSLAASTKRAAEEALVAEPVLPKIVRQPISAHEEQQLVDRLQHLYPDIVFTLGGDQSLTVRASDGSKFHEWLAAVSYLDSASAQYRWSVKEFCVGKCVANELMHAVLVGEKVSFEAPQ
jgi:hypothetical protein